MTLEIDGQAMALGNLKTNIILLCLLLQASRLAPCSPLGKLLKEEGQGNRAFPPSVLSASCA